MTITVSTNSVTWQGNGATTVFPYSFAVPAASDLTLLYTTAAGVQTTVASSAYTITGAGQPTAGGGPQGGTLTYAPSGLPIPAGSLLTLIRTVPNVQPNSMSNQGGLWPLVVEGNDDNLEMQIQQLQNQANRALLFNPADTGPFATFPPAAQRAGQMLGFDGNGNPIAAQPSAALVSALMAPVVAAATTALATGLLAYLSPQSGAVARSLTGKLGDVVSVKDFGALGNGVSDDTAAIQAAINALGPYGGDVLFPPGRYKITSTLNIGNGSAGVVSTVQGVRLVGSGMPCPVVVYWNGVNTTPATELVWAGGGAAVVSINGPLAGWGLQNLHINGGLLATYGIYVQSARFGSVSDVIVENCVTVQIASTTVATWAGCDLTDSLKNSWRNIIVGVPATANAGGILLTGEPGNTSDTDTNHFDNLLVAFSADANTHWGIHLRNCDTNYFNNVHMSGGGSNTYGFVLDYTGSAGNWPGGCQFNGVDCGTAPWLNVGGPVAGQSGPNMLFGLSQGNGGTWPNLAGLTRGLPVMLSAIEFTNQTGAIALQNIYTVAGPAIVPRLLRITFYLSFGTAGTAGTLTPVFGWNDGSAKTLSAAAIATTAGYAQGSFICTPSSGAISFQMASSGITGSPVYFFFINVEQLS